MHTKHALHQIQISFTAIDYISYECNTINFEWVLITSRHQGCVIGS